MYSINNSQSTMMDERGNINNKKAAWMILRKLETMAASIRQF
jgi:hypothetical protein